jgi:thiosulfate/3-mercaptopyruvate sulfurtransferase
MNRFRASRPRLSRPYLGLAALLVVLACSAPAARAVSPADGIRSADLLEPAALAKTIALPAAKRPLLVHVGFEVLYRGGHIPGSVYAGPGSRPAGLAALKRALGPVPRDRAVVLYCGCCPWAHCPNVAPAFRAAKKLGFRDVRVLRIADDMQKDWVDKGYPVAAGKR